MRMPPADSSPETIYTEYGQYHLARLRADKNLKDVADGFEKVQGRLKARLDALENAHTSVVTAGAIRDGEDEALDEAVRGLSSEILGMVNNNRKSPLYVKYFPQGTTPVVVAPLEDEMRKVGVILGLLAQETNLKLVGHAGPIQAALDRLAAAISAHKAAMTAENQVDGLLKAEKLNWLDAYKLDYKAIGHVYYNDDKKVDSFFRPAAKTKKNNGGGGAPTAPKA